MPINPNQTVTVPAVTDWMAILKTSAIVVVFLASSGAVITGHSTPDVIALAGSTGVAIGVLRLSDVAANIINVKSFLNKPDTGVVPQAVGTPLITTSSVTQNGAPPNVSA